MHFFNLSFLFGAFSIVLIDILLAGDNAIVIAMAVRSLPERQRRVGLMAGGAGAIVLRIALTFFAARILEFRYLKLTGGVLILWIAVKLLADTPGGEEEGQKRPAATLGQAIWLILVADITMSLDNILAIAATSQGNLLLLTFGLGLSITFVVAASSVLARIMNKYTWILYLGAALLGRVAGDMMITDPSIEKLLQPSQTLIVAVQVVGAVVVVGVSEIWKRWRGR